MTELLIIHDLTVRYGAVTALRGVSLTLEAHALTAVVGPNGAGKSTLLLTIAGVLRPASGTVSYQGSLLTGAPEDRLRRGIALVPERRHIFGSLTVEENLRLGALSRGDTAGAKTDTAELLERFPILKDKFKALAAQMSGGEQQQLAIARSLLSSPNLLLVDEPSLGLAPRLVAQTLDFIAGLRSRGVTVLLVEQNARQALAASDYAYLLRSGEIGAIEPEHLAAGEAFDLYFGVAAPGRTQQLHEGHQP